MTGTTEQATEAKLSELIACWEAIGPQARVLLVALADRLATGAERHGDFELGRDWGVEADEELLDGTIYLAAQALQKASKPAHELPPYGYMPKVGETVRIVARRFDDDPPYAGWRILVTSVEPSGSSPDFLIVSGRGISGKHYDQIMMRVEPVK